MDAIHTDLQSVLAHIDNIFLFRTIAGKLFQRLHMVFVSIKDYGFELKPAKYSFFTTLIKFLRLIIDLYRKLCDLENIKAI